MLTGASCPTSQSTSCAAAEPSSSIFTVSPFADGGARETTDVLDPATPALSATTPMSANDRVSVGFDFAPMIPFNDG